MKTVKTPTPTPTPEKKRRNKKNSAAKTVKEIVKTVTEIAAVAMPIIQTFTRFRK